MISIKYSTKFWLGSFVHTDGTRTVRLTVCWKGQRVTISLPVRISEDKWDESSEMAKPSKTDKNAREVNKSINSNSSRLIDIFRSAETKNHIPTKNEVKDALTGNGQSEEGVNFVQSTTENTIEETQIDAHYTDEGKATPIQEKEEEEARATKAVHPIARTITEFVVDQTEERGWVPITAKKFYTLREDLLKAGLKNVEDMNGDGVQKFLKSLGKRDLENAVLMKKASILRWFLGWCRRKGYLDNDDYKLHQPHLKCPQKEVIYLTWEELLQMYYFDYGSHTALDQARDVFCFCAFTGLRYSDAKRLKWSNVYDKHIRIVTQKTSDALKIELNKYSRGIIEKYRQEGVYSPDKLVLPAISTQKSNEHLKDCAMLAQIDETLRLVSFKGNKRVEKSVLKWEVITTHCARRTFVVNALRLGISAEVIMKWTGHSDFKAMKPYVAIVDELKEQSMALFDQA